MDYINEIFPERMETHLISTAITKMKRWRHIVADNRNLRKKALKATEQSQNVPCNQKLVDEIAKTLTKLEDVLTEKDALKVRVLKLEQELAVRPTDMSGALAEAMRKIRESK